MNQKEMDLFTVRELNTIEDALAKIESNSHRSAIVLDNKNRVVGTVSDGDIRKAMLDHRLLSTPIRNIMNMNFVWLGPDETARAEELFQKYHLFIIPVLHSDNLLVDILTAY